MDQDKPRKIAALSVSTLLVGLVLWRLSEVEASGQQAVETSEQIALGATLLIIFALVSFAWFLWLIIGRWLKA